MYVSVCVYVSVLKNSNQIYTIVICKKRKQWILRYLLIRGTVGREELSFPNLYNNKSYQHIKNYLVHMVPKKVVKGRLSVTKNKSLKIFVMTLFVGTCK